MTPATVTHHPLHFYDSANPRNVPSGVCAAIYINGFAWLPQDINRMSGIIAVSVRPEPSWAKHARVLDIETGAAKPSDWPAFAHERFHLGFNDATAYVNKSNIAEVHALTLEAKLPYAFYWVATLNGHPEGPVFEVADGTVHAWAEQYQGGFHAPFDVSILYGADTFHKP